MSLFTVVSAVVWSVGSLASLAYAMWQLFHG